MKTVKIVRSQHEKLGDTAVAMIWLVPSLYILNTEERGSTLYVIFLIAGIILLGLIIFIFRTLYSPFIVNCEGVRLESGEFYKWEQLKSYKSAPEQAESYDYEIGRTQTHVYPYFMIELKTGETFRVLMNRKNYSLSQVVKIFDELSPKK